MEVNGGREVLRGETTGESCMRGVWGVSSGRVHVESSDDSTWKSSRAAATVDPPDGQGGQDIQDVLPNEGGAEAVSSGGVPGALATRTAMRVQFVHRHVQDTVVMLEEGNLPHPWCPRCNLQVPSKALNGRHLGTAQCKKGAERKRRRLAETETR